jgi:rare lipoprotein A
LFGSGASEQPHRRPPPPPLPDEYVRVAAGSPPLPPEPVREAPPASVPETPPAPVPEAPRATAVAVHIPRGPIPLPPARPFDLGAAHHPTVLAVTARARSTPIAVLPPRRPLMQASAEKALYFADPSADQFERLSAFDRVKGPTGVQ